MPTDDPIDNSQNEEDILESQSENPLFAETKISGSDPELPSTQIPSKDQQTPVPDKAAFRCDFPDWLETLSCRNRLIAERLAMGDTTSEIAQECNLSRGRVSQIRRELASSWQEFHGELENCTLSAVVVTA